MNGCLNTELEAICPNLLRISFPKYFYQAELNIDEEVIIADVNRYLVSVNKKPIKKLKSGNLVKKVLRAVGVKSGEWFLHEKYIYTFKILEILQSHFEKLLI